MSDLSLVLKRKTRIALPEVDFRNRGAPLVWGNHPIFSEPDEECEKGFSEIVELDTCM
jgi:hypothetical protein